MFLSPFFKSTDKEQWHVLTSTNQEIFFDQSQFISVVFLVLFSLVFPCCVFVFLVILLYLIYHLCQFLNRNYLSITKKSRAFSCHSLFLAWECKKKWILLNFVPQSIFLVLRFPRMKSGNCQWSIKHKLRCRKLNYL